MHKVWHRGESSALHEICQHGWRKRDVTYLMTTMLTRDPGEHGYEFTGKCTSRPQLTCTPQVNAEQGIANVSLTAAVEEGRDLSGNSTVPVRLSVYLLFECVSPTYRVGVPRMSPSTSLRSSGVKTGYFGVSEFPACILASTS